MCVRAHCQEMVRKMKILKILFAILDHHITNTAVTIKGRVQITNLLYLVNYIEINCIKEKFIFNITRDRQDIIF